ncbi:energy-coupling factor ABC transporter ATP-binding protein [candidate division KSB1 bacterium]|nr:energy-coupling factor ABC transporter ATP-binding protein [candidate division KSB1 bacterium]
MTHLKLVDVGFRYSGISVEKRPVLEAIQLEIRSPEIIGLVGRSGSAKTTLIQHFNGLLKPTQGQIFLDGRAFFSREIALTEIRRRIGLVFQFPESQFFEETVAAEIAYGLKNLNFPVTDIAPMIDESLTLVGLDPRMFRERNPHFLSEGEKRRVAMASVIAMQPEILVLDEPTAGLDSAGIELLQKIIVHYTGHGRTIFIVSHNMELLFELVPRLIVLNQGKIVFDGPKQALLARSHQLSEWGLKPPLYQQYLQKIKHHFDLKESEIATRKVLLECCAVMEPLATAFPRP